MKTKSKKIKKSENLKTETSWWRISIFCSSFKLDKSNQRQFRWNQKEEKEKSKRKKKENKKIKIEKIPSTFLIAIESAQKKYLLLNSTFNRTPK